MLLLETLATIIVFYFFSYYNSFLLDPTKIEIHDYVMNQTIEIELLDVMRTLGITVALFELKYLYVVVFTPDHCAMLNANLKFKITHTDNSDSTMIT